MKRHKIYLKRIKCNLLLYHAIDLNRHLLPIKRSINIKFNPYRACNELAYGIFYNLNHNNVSKETFSAVEKVVTQVTSSINIKTSNQYIY